MAKVYSELHPLLYLSSDFRESVIRETLSHPKTETGGYIFGYRARENGQKILFVTSTYTPKQLDETSRSGGHFSIGGENSPDFYDWQKAHAKRNIRHYLD